MRVYLLKDRQGNESEERMMMNLGCARRKILAGAAGLIVMLAMLPARMVAQVTTTTVQGTVYRADGTAASGTVIVSWPSFSTSTGEAIAAGSATASIGADGFVSLSLAPNQGAYPEGSYYTAVYHLGDGTVNKEYWVVPQTSVATISTIRAELAPATIAVQPIDKAYVDTSIAAITGDFLPLTGGSMSGALQLAADPTSSDQATTKHYTDALAATELPIAGGTMSGTLNTPNSATKLPKVDVRHPDFGTGCSNAADPSGTADSTCAIQAAINYAVATPQGKTYPEVYLPAGTYKITAVLSVPCQVHFVGDGPQATIIRASNNSANALKIYSGASVQPNVWTCNGSLENMTIDAPGGHLYTATLIELQNAVGYTIYRVRGSGGGGRGLALLGSTERLDVIDTEWDAVRWPIVAVGNELKFLDTQIESAGESSDGYCWGPRNCANGVFPGYGWSTAQVLNSASGNGTTATYVLTGNGGAGSANTPGVSPLVAGHWFTVEGITGSGATGLNGLQQVKAVFNNCSAVTNGSCSTTSTTQYVIQSANGATASGGISVANATYQPTILPERVAAFYISSEQFSVLGGSIKANWFSGCFRTDSAYSGLIEGFYCEGFPENGQPHMNADIEMNGEPFSTTLTGAISGSAAPVASTLWAPSYVNDPADASKFGSFPFNIYPQDYVAGSTVCSAYVKTPSGGCVQQGQFETVEAIFSGDGEAHFPARNMSGTTAPSSAGNIVWPAGSILAGQPDNNYGTLTLKSNHFESVDTPGLNWAVSCNDATDMICASAIVGSIPNGTTVRSTAGAGATGNASFENDEWWGVGGADNELTGAGFIKVSTKGNVTATGGGAGITAGETQEAALGQFMANTGPSVVAVQEADGTYAWMSYSNPQRGTLANNTNGPFYDSAVFGLADANLGANPNSNYTMGRQFAGSSCTYDVAPTGQTHATYRFCMMGGPTNTTTRAGWEYDIWNGTAWVNGFKISGQSNSTASTAVSGNSETQGALTAATINGEVTVDGTTYTTLNAAWTAAAALATSSGKNQTIRLGPGTFPVTATMNEPTNGACVNLIGSGGSTVNAGSAAATNLSVPSNLSGDLVFLGNTTQAQGCTFKDLVVLAATHATHAFELQWFRGLLIDNVTVNDTTGDGIDLGEAASSTHQSNFLLRNITVSYNTTLFTPATRPAYGIHLLATAMDSHLDDITVRNALTAGVFNEGTGNTGYLVHGFGYPYTCTTAPCSNTATSGSAANASYATNYVIYDTGGGGTVWTDTYADSPAVAGFYIGANGVALHGGHIQWPDLTSFPSANLAFVAAAVTNNMLIADIDCLGMSNSVNWITYATAAGAPPSFTSVHHLTGCGNYSQSLEPAQVSGFSSGGANINDPSGAIPRVWSTPIAAASNYAAYAAQLYTGYQGDIFQGHFSGVSPFFNITSQGTIRSNGGLALSTVLNTATTLTLTTANKNVIANAASGAQTITLPSCFAPLADNAPPTGLELNIIKSDISANAVTLQTVSSESINYQGATATSLVISSAGKRTLVCAPDYNWYAY